MFLTVKTSFILAAGQVAEPGQVIERDEKWLRDHARFDYVRASSPQEIEAHLEKEARARAEDAEEAARRAQEGAAADDGPDEDGHPEPGEPGTDFQQHPERAERGTRARGSRGGS